jgi:hypothetical protein
MKQRLLLIAAILGMTTAVTDVQRSTLAAPPDAQSQAAALLHRPQQHGTANDLHNAPFDPSSATDAQASAAALLSGHRSRDQVKTTKATVAVTPRSAARVSGDAQAQAAALLSGSRLSPVDSQRTLRRARVKKHSLEKMVR